MRNFKLIALITLFITTLMIAMYYASLDEEEYAVNGVIDVQESFSDKKVISLDGQWEFYWNQLLEAQDFKDS